jgi:hypothetical protein
MSINTAGLPSYTEQDTRTLISKTIENIRLIDKVKEEKKIKAILYGKGKK